MKKEKWKEVNDGDYIMVYSDLNIYKVYRNDFGELCIDFRGKEKMLKSFGGMLYKVFTDEEIFNCGKIL